MTFLSAGKYWVKLRHYPKQSCSHIQKLSRYMANLLDHGNVDQYYQLSVKGLTSDHTDYTPINHVYKSNSL